MQVRQDYERTFPYPVAMAYRIARDPQEIPVRRLWALHFTVLQALKLTTLPVVAQYLKDPRPTEKMDREAVEAINRAIAGIRQPHFGDWITLFWTLAEHIPTLGIEPVFPLPELAKWIKERKVKPFSREYSSQGSEWLNHLEAFRELRNGLAHGGMFPPEEQCLKILDHYLPILEELLAKFDFLSKGEWLALAQEEPPGPLDSSVCVRRLLGADLPEPETIELDRSLREAFEESRLVLRIDGQVLPLYPLFYQTPTEPCAHYDGHFALRVSQKEGVVEEKFILYLGMQSRFHESEPFDRLRELLERRRIQWWLTKQEAAPWTLYDSVRHYAWQTLEDLKGRKYFPETYLERKEVMEHFWRFLDGERWSGFMLLGEAGSGKTAWCAFVVEKLLQEGLESAEPEADLERRGRNLVFFIRGDALDFSEGRTLFQNLAERMGLKVQALKVDKGAARAKAERDEGFTSFADLLEHLNRRWKEDRIRADRRLIFVLDALNECSHPERAVRETLELVQAAARYPWCKVVFTVRSEYVRILEAKQAGTTAPDPFYEVRHRLYQPELPEEPKWMGEAPPPGVVLERLTEEEAAQIYRRYQETRVIGEACTTPWEELPEETRRILTNPLLLHLFMKAHGGRPATRVVSEAAVFRSYLDDLRQRFPQMREATERVIGYMLKVGRAVLDDNDANAIRLEWAEGKTFEEQQRLMAPLELLEYLGLMRKRVRIEGGGYVFVFQKVLEQLIYEFLRKEEGTEEPTEEYWLALAKEPEPFPEYGNAFAFLFREIHGRGKYEMAARLAEEGQDYVARALENFLKELAVESWEPGRVKPEFERCVEGLAKHGKEQTARALFNAGFDLHFTRYAPAAEAAWQACRKILETLHEANPENVDIAYGLAVLLINLGVLLRTYGVVKEAKKFLRQATGILEALHKTNPEDGGIASRLAIVLTNLGVMLLERGELGGAERYYRRATKILEALHKANPENVEIANDLSGLLTNLGFLLSFRGEVEEAEKCYRKAIEIREALYKANPENVRIADGLAVALTNLGELLRSSGKVEAAERCYYRAEEILEALHKANPENVEIANRLATVLTNLGELLRSRGEVEEAEKCHRRAMEILEALHKANPENAEIANDLAGVLTNLGVLLGSRGEVEEEEKCYRRAIEIREALYKAHPENAEIANDLAGVLTNLGVLLWSRGEFEEAEKCYRRAMEILEALHKANPENVEIANDLARALTNLGVLLRSCGEVEEEEKCYRRAMEILEALYKANPENVEIADYLAWVLTSLGELLWARGEVEEAEKCYRRAMEILEALHKANSENVEIADDLARALTNLGELLWARGEVEEAEKRYSRAMEILEALHKANPENVEIANDLARALTNLGLLLEERGEWGDALQHYERGVQLLADIVRRGVISRTPDLVRALRLRFKLRVKMEQWDDAADDLRQALMAAKAYLATNAPPEPVYREFKKFLPHIRDLTQEEWAQIFAALGKDAEAVLKLLEAS